jgi:hypothetical protein
VTYLLEWLRAFGLTEAIEIPIVLALTRSSPPVGGMPAWRRAAIAFFASLATHPIVWFVIPELALADTTRIALSEAWATGAELAFYWVALPTLGVKRAAIVSVAANAASFGAGLLLWKLG